jgi:protoheme IX farnesyltransferase
MLPVVAGRAETTRQILIYSFVLAPVSMLPCALGFAGAVYGATAGICGAFFVVLALRLSRSSEVDRRAAHRLFAFSIVYLFVLFAALLADNSSNRWFSRLSPQAASIADEPSQAGSRTRSFAIARSSFIVSTDEA